MKKALIIPIISLSLLFFLPRIVLAETGISFDLSHQNLVVGQNFMADIIAQSNDTNFYSADFEISFNRNVIDLTTVEISAGSLLGGCATGEVWWSDPYNTDTGTINVQVFRDGCNPLSVNSPTILARLNFTAISAGATSLAFVDVNYRDSSSTQETSISSTSSQIITVISADMQDPILSIDAVPSPTDTSPVTITGTVSDNVEVAQVTWSNDRGGSGQASIINGNWTLDVYLQVGDNTITITAIDSSNNSTSDSSTIITYSPTQAVVSLNPAVQNVDIGNTLAITLNVSNVVDMDNMTADILFDSTKISYDHAVISDDIANLNWTADVFDCMTPSSDCISLLIMSDFVNLLNGNADIITIYFTTNNTGTSNFIYANNHIFDAFINEINSSWNSASATITDNVAPTITITSPASDPYLTISTPISISGAATDNVGVTSVTWVNDRGGAGQADGLDNWSFSADLQTGDNVITATAHDADGNTSTDIITITYSPQIQEAAVSLNPTAQTVEQGSIFSVTLNIADVTDLDNMMTDIEFDGTNIIFDHAEASQAMNDLGWTVDAVDCLVPSQNCINILAASDFMNPQILTGNADIVTLYFTAAAVGQVDYSYTNNHLYDAFFTEIPAIWATAAVTIVDNTAPVILDMASITTTTTATITWTTDEPATSQAEYGQTTSYDSQTSLDTNLVTFHNVNISGLTVNTVYHYRVRTKDAANNETISEDYTFKTTDIPDTTSPILTVVTPIADFPIGSNFDYTYNSSEAGTVSYSGCSANLYPNAIAGDNTITFDQPADGTYAACAISVTDAAGNISLPLSVNTFIVDTINPVITNVVVNVSTSSASLAWTTDELSISLAQYGLTNILPYPLTQSATGITTNPAVNITGLAIATTYYYRIISLDLSGNIEFLDGLLLTTALPDTIAPALSNGSPSGSLAAGTTGTTLSVNSDEDATCKYSTTAGVAYNAMSNSFATTGAKSHTTAVSGLTNGQSYNYYIHCQDASGNFNNVDYIISFSVDNPPVSNSDGGGGGYIPPADTTAPATPTNFIASSSGANLSLSWTNPTDADFNGVIIIRKENSAPAGRSDGSEIYNGKNNTFIDPALTSGKLYYYAIYAYDNNSNYSAPLAIMVDRTTGTDKNTADNNQVKVLSAAAYFSLAGLPKEEVESAGLEEANAVYDYNKFIQLDKTAGPLYDKLIFQSENLDSRTRFAIAYFIQAGTPSTLRLGAGERAGVINSFKAAFGRLPASALDWQDVIKIANGRWPGQKSQPAEDRARITFKKVYQREADLKNNKDANALMIMAYGLRPVIRNTGSEKSAIKIFKNIYGRNPFSATDWDIMRTIAYSGTKR